MTLPARADAGAELLASALAYATWGRRVLPLHTPRSDGRCDCGNRDCGSPGKHPRTKTGRHDASADPDVIRRWWSRWPHANVGIVMGAGVIAVDVDPDKGGGESLRQLGALPDTVTALTGGGGQHLIFASDYDGPSRIGVRAGLDLISEGYIVAPPSRHANGRRYAWEIGHGPGEIEPAPAPGAVRELLATGAGSRAATPLPERIQEGARDATLTSLAGTMRRRGASGDAIEAALLEENRLRCEPPLPERQVRKIAVSVGRYAPASPSANGAGPGGGPAGLRFPRTDSGNAELFAHLYGERVRFDHRRGRWLLWTGQRWEEDGAERVYQLAKDATRWRYAQAPAIDDLKERDKEAAWSIASEARGRLEATLALARTEPSIADAGTDWDLDPWLLGVANGVVDLRAGTLRPGRHEDWITMSTGIEYDPAATAPRFEAFLREIYDGDGAVVGFDQRLSGYALTGDISEQGFWTGIGRGANGKSVRLAVARLMLGDYAYNAPFQTFELANRPSIPNDLAALAGRRLVTASETADGARLNESRIKALTGGDPVTARFLNHEWFTYNPVCKVMLAVNHKPRVNDDSYGFWRRVWLVPFTREFRDDADAHLLDKLREELPGILAWAVRGCLEWQRVGLQVPERVKAATEVYRQESDPLGDFLAECCEIGPGHSAGGGELYRRYQAWAVAQGLRDRETLTAQKFGRLLTEGFEKSRAGSGRVVYGGIRLRTEGYSVSGRRIDPPSHILPLEKALTRSDTKVPSNPSEPSAPDPDTLTCPRCGSDDLAYDGDGALYCPACRAEVTG